MKENVFGFYFGSSLCCFSKDTKAFVCKHLWYKCESPEFPSFFAKVQGGEKENFKLRWCPNSVRTAFAPHSNLFLQKSFLGFIHGSHLNWFFTASGFRPHVIPFLSFFTLSIFIFIFANKSGSLDIFLPFFSYFRFSFGL